MYGMRKNHWRHGPLAMLTLVLLLALVGCSSTSDDGDGDQAVAPAPAGGGGEHKVELSHSYFKPAELTIGAGDTVTFQNVVSMSHPLVSPGAGLYTGEFTQGERSFTFDNAGTFTITNTGHGVTMQIVVQ